MRPILPLILCATVAATGCARVTDSRFNPLNWFGRAEVVAPVDANGKLRPLVAEGARAQSFDSRNLVASVANFRIERTPDGAIVRATGATATPGQFNAQLVPVGIDNGTLLLAFRAESPARASTRTSEPRQITAAYLMDNAELNSVRAIRVQAAQNSLISRR